MLVVIAVLAIVAYLYKRRNREPQVDNGDDGGTDRPPDGAYQLSLSPRPLIPPAVQVVVETQQSPTETVTVFSKREGTPRHVHMQSLLRYSDENGVTDPVDFPALDTTTSSFVYSFSDEGYDIKYLFSHRAVLLCLSLCAVKRYNRARKRKVNVHRAY